MRIKRHIGFFVLAVIIFAIGLATVIFHYCMKPDHSLVCFFINAFQLITLAIGGFYLFRGYQKKDFKLLKIYYVAVAITIVTLLIYCCNLAQTYNYFAKFAIVAGCTDIFILSALFFGKDLSKKLSHGLCLYTVFSTLILAIAFTILAREAAFGDRNTSALTTLLDLINCVGFSCILTIATALKYIDKEERAK